MARSPKRSRGRPRHDDILTPAEWRIVHAVQHGLSNGEISARRKISRDAVKFHLANALAKLALPGRRALRSWFRPPRESPLNRKETRMTSIVALGPIGQLSRSVGDLAAAQAWYAEALGLKHLYTVGTLAFFDCGGVRLALSQSREVPPAESIIYFRVDDIRASFQALQAKGVEFIAAPHLVHRHADGLEEWMAFFKDPEGRPLALMSQAR